MMVIEPTHPMEYVRLIPLNGHGRPYDWAEEPDDDPAALDAAPANG